MPLSAYARHMLPTLEDEIKNMVATVRHPGVPLVGEGANNGLWDSLHEMLAYHMGWVDCEPEASGKRIRPAIVLLVTDGAGGNWRTALPAAAAVELLHNFSLIHDDIEDNSELRRGRPTVWKRWGIPQAINTGDVLFTVSHLAMLKLHQTAGAEVTLEASRLLHETCLALTQGQFLDISYENERSLPQKAYWPMIQGKTASLLAASAEFGAMIARAKKETRQAYRNFGLNLGMAFQVQDDLLGIWGETANTGKSANSDLVSGKKSLPVLFGLEAGGKFAKRWMAGNITEDEVKGLADELKAEGAYEASQQAAEEFTSLAIKSLEEAAPEGEAGEALQFMTRALLRRKL